MLPEDTSTETLLTTPEGEIYVIDSMRAIYKSSHEATGWQYVNNVRSLSDTWWDGRNADGEVGRYPIYGCI